MFSAGSQLVREKLRGRGEGCRELSGCLPAGPVERNFLKPLCEEGDKGSGGHSRCTRGNCALLDGSCLVRCGSFVCALVAVSAVHFLCRKENEPSCVRHTVSHYALARNLSDYKSFGLEIAKIS